MYRHNRLKQKQISELKNENINTAYTPEKENNYLLWIIHIIKNDSFIYKSQEHTNVQIKVNILFLYLILFRDVSSLMSVFWRRFMVNHRKHRVRFFSDISQWLFIKFLRHFLDFTDVGPEWFLAKLHCAYCTLPVITDHYCFLQLSEINFQRKIAEISYITEKNHLWISHIAAP